MDNNENSSAENNAENGFVPPISEQKSKEELIPKSRFEEVLSQKKSAEETVKVYKDALDQSKREAADANKIAEEVEARVAGIQKDAWKEKALRSIDPNAARLADEIGASFSGNSEEDYIQWAKGLENKILPKLAKDNSTIDGSRSGENATEITPAILAKMTPEQRIAYAEKVLPRVNI